MDPKKNNQDTEYRSYGTASFSEDRNENQESASEGYAEGYAFLFNSRTSIGGWYEELILPGAADNLLQKCDVRALLNHDPNQLLARSNKGTGTLELTLDEKGLKYRFKIPESRADIKEMLARGDLSQSSFGFRIAEQRWTERKDLPDLREIVRFEEIIDITLATYPAYEDTTVALRSKEMARKPEDWQIESEARMRQIKILELTPC